MPCVPAFIRGVVNLRGRILPVLDLKRFFDLPEKGITDLHRIIFVRGCEMEFGLLADEITGVRTIAERTLQPSFAHAHRHPRRLSQRDYRERLVVLNLGNMFLTTHASWSTRRWRDETCCKNHHPPRRPAHKQRPVPPWESGPLPGAGNLGHGCCAPWSR
ncbi:MAG: chemotaxis protein CheW [Chthoniobacteraceae bacterium]